MSDVKSSGRPCSEGALISEIEPRKNSTGRALLFAVLIVAVAYDSLGIAVIKAMKLPEVGSTIALYFGVVAPHLLIVTFLVATTIRHCRFRFHVFTLASILCLSPLLLDPVLYVRFLLTEARDEVSYLNFLSLSPGWFSTLYPGIAPAKIKLIAALLLSFTAAVLFLIIPPKKSDEY